MADNCYLCDYHIHTSHSFDARNTIDEACRAAVRNGVNEIGFADHVGIDPSDEAYEALDFDRYFEDVEKARKQYDGKLKIKLGVEIDFRSTVINETRLFLEKHDFDYVIGGLHYLDGKIVLSTDIFTQNPVEEVWSRYFDELLMMAQADLFDIIAHFDIPKRAYVPLHGRFDWKPYKEQIRAILAEIIKNESVLEINSSGIRKQADEILPSPGIINLYRQLGGKFISFGSDAHSAPKVGCDFDIAIQAAESAGFTHMTTFAARERKLVPIRNRSGH